MTRPVFLLAASGLARETLSVLRAQGAEVAGFLDDDPARHETTLSGIPVLGPISTATRLEGDLVVCAGKGAARRAIVRRLAEAGVGPARYRSVIDDSVRIPDTCRIGEGTILLAGCVLTADVSVGRHVVCMPHVTLTHDDAVEDYATLTAGVTLGGGVVVGQAAYLGMSASVREGLSIGAGALLGMGSVLLSDQPPGTRWAGVPARDLGAGGSR